MAPLDVGDAFRIPGGTVVWVVSSERRANGTWYVMSDRTEVIHTALMARLRAKEWARTERRS